MCGIAFYWAKERSIDREEIRRLFEGAAKRGGDGFGYMLVTPGSPEDRACRIKLNEKVPDKKVWDTHIDDIEKNMWAGDMLFIAFRATPETELQTTPEMLQPIRSPEKGCILIHNGSVTEKDYNQLKNMELNYFVEKAQSTYITQEEEYPGYKFNTKIDSEAIIAQYINYDRDMKRCMENLSGAFAFVLLDTNTGKLYSVTSFLPLAHMYIKGMGYYMHSSLETLEAIQFQKTGYTEGCKALWHHWYAHYMDGYQIIETDIESGLQQSYNYRPKFLHMGRSKEDKSNRKTVLVAASGGVDSGVTALALKHFLPITEYNICMIHFLYGSRSEEEELMAVRLQAETVGIMLQVVDIKSIYQEFIKDSGMLMDRRTAIESGGDKLKSTIAWVAGRNALFASLLLAKAESRLLYRDERKVYIAGGWAQLSEETGGYPDNSFKFIQALREVKKYGYITGQDIEFINVLQNLTKTETWKLGNYLKFPFQFSCSCDNPKLNNDGTITLCLECGSTKLSCIAADRADVYDPRMFNYRINSHGRGVYHRPRFSEPSKVADIKEIIARLTLPADM